jgi:outer membrane protein assembly factor BamE (lipoprotein component of BamABCDE complex)
MKSFWSVCALLLLASWMAACSVYMEATRPTPIDTSDYPAGMTRDEVFTKLGPPYNTATESGGATCDYYKLYTRGYGAGGKIPIAVTEAAADVFTGGLAEIILTPTEGETRNEKHPVAFCYVNQKLVRVTFEGMPSATPTATPGVSAIESDTAPTLAPTPSPTPQPASVATPRPGR